MLLRLEGLLIFQKVLLTLQKVLLIIRKKFSFLLFSSILDLLLDIEAGQKKRVLALLQHLQHPQLRPPPSQAPTALSTNLPSYNMRRRQGNLRFRILDHLYMDYLGHANLATFTFTLQYEDAPAQKFVDFDRRSLVKVHTVFQSNFSHIVCRSTWTSSKLQNSLEPLFLRVRGPLFANVCEFMF